MLLKKKERQTTKLHYKNEVPYISYESLSQYPQIAHLFTTRFGGVSQGVYHSLNLRQTTEDSVLNIADNYKIVANLFDVEAEDMVISDQTHTTNILRVDFTHKGMGLTKKRNFHDVDGLITNEKGLLLATVYADCVPLYFFDPVKKAIGLSHSGWKGTLHKMGAITIKEMVKEFGCDPSHMIVAIGPSICQECYEVGDEVYDAFLKVWKDETDRFFTKGEKDKYHLDLWKVNEYILREAGIKKENIIVPDICTCCNFEVMFSHRAHGNQRGNLGAFLMLTN